MFIEVPYNVETGEAERIAVDWTARGGGSGTSRTFIDLSSRLINSPCLLPSSGIALANPKISGEDAA